MNKDNLCVVAMLLTLLCLLIIPHESAAFNDEGHKALSDRSTRVSGLDNFLKTVLGFEFSEGIEQVIKDGEKGRVLDRIAQVGAVNEDRPLLRSRHHFHNPTLVWDQAGWRPLLVQLGISSPLWSQDGDQVIGGKHSWQDARQSYFDALTSTDTSERKGFFADTFESLGHLIHLVQDLATPAHTRNDTHIISDLFHEWAETAEAQNMIANTTPAALSSSFLNQQSPNSSAPVPIARLFDTTATDLGALALGTGSNIGIAEYSNANFFSDDTILPETLPFPGLSNLDQQSEIDQTTGKKTTYLYFKSGFGETNYRLAKLSSLRDIVATNVPTDVSLDQKVMEDYGGKLFPRAIGYSAGLIDYFFRGSIAYGFWHTEGPSSSPPTALTGRLVNATFPEEDTGAGTVTVVLVYFAQDFTTEVFPPFVVSTPFNATVTSTGQEVTFPFGSLPFPNTLGGSVVYQALLVYRGPLGDESDAVIASPCGGADVLFQRSLTPEGNQLLKAGPVEGCHADGIQ